jgi:aarF domain-containing kinase
MHRVLQGAGLVAKQVALHLSEEAARGKLVAPIRWEGVIQQAEAAAAAAATWRLPSTRGAFAPSSMDGSASSSTHNTVERIRSTSPLPEKLSEASPPPSQSSPSLTDIQTELPSSPPPSTEDASSWQPAQSIISAPEPVEPPPGSAAASAEQRPTKAVPTMAVTRAVHFGGLGLGLAAGAAASAVRRAIRGEPLDRSLLATDANVERLASTLCRLRGAALKVGQMLSFNDADVLPPALRVAMERVRDGADWMPARQLEETLRSELGDGWRSQLVSFEPTPIASASIGQVHRAVLEDGRTVAIKVQYPGVADSIRSDLWSMKQLIYYTGLVPPGLFLDRILEVAQRELLQECDYVNEATATRRFKRLMAPYPEFAVPAVVQSLSSQRVLTTEWMEGLSIDRAAKGTMTSAERDRVGSRLLWLSLTELFTFRFMQTDPNWSNFLYAPRTRQLSLIDFGACQSYDPQFVDSYLRLVMACAEGASGAPGAREAILHHSHELGFLTGKEGRTMLDAQYDAAVLVGSPFARDAQPFDFGKQDISKRIAKDVATMIKERLTPPREEIYTLHRRLNGCFQLAARVGARIDAREILLSVHGAHQWHVDAPVESGAA